MSENQQEEVKTEAPPKTTMPFLKPKTERLAILKRLQDAIADYVQKVEKEEGENVNSEMRLILTFGADWEVVHNHETETVGLHDGDGLIICFKVGEIPAVVGELTFGAMKLAHLLGNKQGANGVVRRLQEELAEIPGTDPGIEAQPSSEEAGQDLKAVIEPDPDPSPEEGRVSRP